MARIRIISGIAKGKKLILVPGDSTRPITDRVKESLFNILHQDIPGCNFLDLFAGTGSVGIEALSRGAEFVRLCDLHPKAIETIQLNLELSKLTKNAEVLRIDALKLLKKKSDKQFDYLYIAPPQYKQLWITAINLLDKNPNWLVSDGWVIVQINPREYEELALENLSEFDQRKYGNTLLVFYDRKVETDDR